MLSWNSLGNDTGGSLSNKGIRDIEKVLYQHVPGKVVISNRSSDRANAIILTDDGIIFTNGSTSGGMSIKDSITLQGVTLFTGKGENIKKGEYSENSNNTKIFTYQETVLLESIPKEVLSKATGTLGLNLDKGMDGAFPIITDISAGPLPHVHTITMKHVHRIEPPYLYRVPSIINVFKGAINQITQFFKA